MNSEHDNIQDTSVDSSSNSTDSDNDAFVEENGTDQVSFGYTQGEEFDSDEENSVSGYSMTGEAEGENSADAVVQQPYTQSASNDAEVSLVSNNGSNNTGNVHDYSITNFDNTAVNTSLPLDERLSSFEEVGEKNFEDLDLKSSDLLEVDEEEA